MAFLSPIVTVTIRLSLISPLPAPQPLCWYLQAADLLIFIYQQMQTTYIKLQIIYIYELIQVSVISHHPQGYNA